jgi:two-component system KDP operon response regulator KdpE
MTRILIVEDDIALCAALTANLEARGYRVEAVHDGRSALEHLADRSPDAVVLDLGLPDLDGTEVLASVRLTSAVPIVVLTARDDRNDKISALDAGADDYITKPFDSDELAARLRAALRRAPEREPDLLHFDDLVVDLGKHVVTRADQRVMLTPTEFALLEALVTNPDRLLTHSWLLKRVWGPAYGEESGYTRTYIAQLRRKLGDDASQPVFIRTESGLGYRWIAARRSVT